MSEILTKKSIYKKKAILNRLQVIEEEIAKANEYLETDAHSHWHKFRPFFVDKIENDKVSPPHKDWVKNVFIPRRIRELKRAEELLDRFE